MAIEIVDLPIDSMVIFHSYVNVYQRVLIMFSWDTLQWKIPTFNGTFHGGFPLPRPWLPKGIFAGDVFQFRKNNSGYIYIWLYIYIHDGIITYYIIYNQLVVLTILKHMKVNGKEYPVYEMENKTCLKPPTRIPS